jgi:hypothetical protein
MKAFMQQINWVLSLNIVIIYCSIVIKYLHIYDYLYIYIYMWYSYISIICIPPQLLTIYSLSYPSSPTTLSWLLSQEIIVYIHIYICIYIFIYIYIYIIYIYIYIYIYLIGTVAQSSISSSFVGLFSTVSTRKGLENVLELADKARSYYAHQPPEIWIQ